MIPSTYCDGCATRIDLACILRRYRKRGTQWPQRCAGARSADNHSSLATSSVQGAVPNSLHLLLEWFSRPMQGIWGATWKSQNPAAEEDWCCFGAYWRESRSYAFFSRHSVLQQGQATRRNPTRAQPPPNHPLNRAARTLIHRPTHLPPSASGIQ